jgi:hypothetical protein
MPTMQSGVNNVMHTTATTGNGNAFTVRSGRRELNLSIVGIGAISAGTVYIEEASSRSYAGAWSELESFPATEVADGEKISHFSGVFRTIRVRLDGIVGGTISSSIQSD